MCIRDRSGTGSSMNRIHELSPPGTTLKRAAIVAAGYTLDREPRPPSMTQETIQALLEAIELKDQSTAAHTWRVVLYSRALAEEAGASPDVVDRVMYAAALHDVG